MELGCKSLVIAQPIVWVALADLPPKLRSSFDNIHLCSLWYGKGSIDWDSIFQHYLSEVSKDRKI